MSWSDQDNVTISISTEYKDSGAEEGLKKVKDSIDSMAEPSDKAVGSLKELTHRMRESGEESQIQSSPIRAVSWDLLLTGRSLSMMNQGLLGSNQAVRQGIAILYSVASAIRLVVMAYDAQRISAESAAKAGYMSSHYIPPKTPYEIGKRLSAKEAASMPNPYSNIGLDLAKRAPTTQGPIFGEHLWKREATEYKQDVSKNKPMYVPTDYYLNAGRTKQSTERDNLNVQATNIGAAQAGVIQPLTQAAEVTAGQAGMNMAVGAIGDAAQSPSMWETLGKIAPFMMAPMFFAQGGVVPRDMNAYVHKGEAVVREKDYHAINEMLSNANQPMKSNIDSVRQPNMALPNNTQNISNGNNDARSFTNINVTTGPISSNVDVNNLFKKMAQAQTQDSRRRTGQ